MTPGQNDLDPDTRDFYLRTLEALEKSGVPFLVGGAYALACHSGIVRHTKDLDVFVHRRDRDRVLEALASAGCMTDVTFPHWLAKARCGENFADVIYSSGNGVAEVDDEWFAHALDGDVLGAPVRLCPAEEMLWSKAFIQERERFDGADVAHLLRSRADALDWPRVLRRFGPHGRVLLAHLVLFGFIYPAERGRIPDWVVRDLTDRLLAESSEPAPSAKVCQGTLLSREQYLIDIGRWGYEDARLRPRGPMAAEDVAHWTAAIEGPRK